MNRNIPPLLWISTVGLGVVSLIQLSIALNRHSGALFMGVVVQLVLLFGLARGHRWAYILLLVFALLGVAASFGKGIGSGLGVLIGDAIIIVPMLLCTDFFFEKREKSF